MFGSAKFSSVQPLRLRLQARYLHSASAAGSAKHDSMPHCKHHQSSAAPSTSSPGASRPSTSSSGGPSDVATPTVRRSDQPPATAFERIASLALTTLQILEKLETLVLAAQLVFYLLAAACVAYAAYLLYKQAEEMEAWWQEKKENWSARKARLWKPLGDAGTSARGAADAARSAVEDRAAAVKRRTAAATSAVEEGAAAARNAISETSEAVRGGAGESLATAKARLAATAAAAKERAAAAGLGAGGGVPGRSASSPQAEAEAEAETAAEPEPEGKGSISAAGSGTGRSESVAAPAESPLTERLKRFMPSRNRGNGSA